MSREPAKFGISAALAAKYILDKDPDIDISRIEVSAGVEEYSVILVTTGGKDNKRGIRRLEAEVNPDTKEVKEPDDD